jgi:hypothetical protein
MLTPSQPTKGLTQRELFAKSDRKIVREIVSDQERLIDASILTAHRSGFNHIEHELPVNFNISNMDKADAQTMIYSELLTIYKSPESAGGKGFENVHIDMISLKPILRINWLNGMDDDERRRRREYIRGCMLGKK